MKINSEMIITMDAVDVYKLVLSNKMIKKYRNSNLHIDKRDEKIKNLNG